MRKVTLRSAIAFIRKAGTVNIVGIGWGMWMLLGGPIGEIHTFEISRSSEYATCVFLGTGMIVLTFWLIVSNLNLRI